MSTLSYNECDIDRGAIASARESFGELHTLISGRSGEYNTITRHVGFEFSDLIGEGLRGAANENQFAWSSSMMACTHAYGILDKISTDVQWYEEKIEEIKANLSQAITDCSEPDNLTLVNQIIESHNLDAERAWRDLEERCDESEEILKEGPTPENIRLLAEGGYFGNNENIGFYTTGDFDYYHVDEGRAEAIATHVRHAVLDGNEVSIELLEENPEYLELISVVVSRGLLAQQNGENLLDGEVEFLETLFGDLGDIGGDNPGFLAFMDQVNSSEHIDNSLREDINRNLANSMLILSDEDIGGGMNQLPQDVSDILDVPEFPDVNSLNHDSELPGFMDAYSDWGGPFSTLSTLLDSSGPGVQGGTEVSTTLLGTVAATLDISYFAGEPNDEHFQNVIDVASRYEEANHIIITGEDFEGNTFEHHASHGNLTPESLLETFYTHDWDDDGSAVSGITDWIVDYQQSNDEERSSLGDRTFLELVDLVTSDEIQEKLNTTGHKVEDPVLKNDDGDPVVWEDVSFGHLNPEIAGSFADIFLANLDAMGSDYGIDANDPNAGADGGGSSVDPAGNMLIDMDKRNVFAQHIMGSEEAATLLKTEVFIDSSEDLDKFMGEGDSAGDAGIPQKAAILNGIIDNALSEAGDIRVENSNTSIDYRNQVTGNAIDILFAGIPSPDNLPVADMGIEALKNVIKEAVQDPHVPDSDDDLTGKYITQLKNNAMLHAAGSMSPDEFNEFEFSIPEEAQVLDSEGRFISEWEGWTYAESLGSTEGDPLSQVSRNDVNNAIKTGFNMAGDSRISDLLGFYGEEYDDYYDAVEKR